MRSWSIGMHLATHGCLFGLKLRESENRTLPTKNSESNRAIG